MTLVAEELEWTKAWHGSGPSSGGRENTVVFNKNLL